MAIKSNKVEAHWAYFLSLKADFEELSRYIEFTQPNFNTYGTAADPDVRWVITEL